MNAGAESQPFAWQPITPRGVAAFAHASFGRLILVQFICALVSAGTIIWLLQTAWFPTVRQAIHRLPPQGAIRAGSLDWQTNSPLTLAENRFIALTVDLNHSGETRSPSHLQVEFGQTDFKVISLFGFSRRAYPRGYTIGFNRSELEPWWGAWAPPILAIAGGTVIAALFIAWTVLATLYFLPLWLIAFFANRDLSLSSSWRLAGAVLMPGALFQVVAILFYGLGALDLLRLVTAAALHFVVSWIYLFLAPLCLPKHPAISVLKPNPFASTNTKS